MSEEIKCQRCHLPIHWSGDAWYVDGTDTTADGLSYCPPDPDHQGEFGDHDPIEICDHDWVAGVMVVHPEDVKTVVAQRDIECIRCGIIAGPTGTHGIAF